MKKKSFDYQSIFVTMIDNTERMIVFIVKGEL